jgi:hypothetical protein
MSTSSESWSEIHGIYRIENIVSRIRNSRQVLLEIPMPENVSLPENTHVSITCVSPGEFGHWISVLAVENDKIVLKYNHPKFVEIAPTIRYVRTSPLAIHWTVRFDVENVVEA